MRVRAAIFVAIILSGCDKTTTSTPGPGPSINPIPPPTPEAVLLDQAKAFDEMTALMSRIVDDKSAQANLRRFDELVAYVRQVNQRMQAVQHLGGDVNRLTLATHEMEQARERFTLATPRAAMAAPSYTQRLVDVQSNAMPNR